MNVEVERHALPVDGVAEGTLTVAVHRPARPAGVAVLLVPGAGGDLDGEGLTALAETVADGGHLTIRANLPHHEAGRRAPRASTSVPGLRALVAAAREAFGLDGPLVIGGRSYGGRVATMLVAEGLAVDGLLLSGYPLHPPGKPEQLRVEHWPRIGAPCLFLQGDADPMCDLELLEANLRKLPRRPHVVIVPGGDHALRVTKARSPAGRPQDPVTSVRAVAGQLHTWLAERADPRGRG